MLSPATFLPALAAVIGLAVAACSPSASSHAASPAPMASKRASATKPAALAARTRAVSRVAIGVYEPSQANSWAGIQAFGEQAGQPVNYVVTYLNARDPFPQRLGQDAAAHGAELILQLQPSMPMARVAAGDDDAYLDSLAAQVRDYHHQVIVSWAAEANGNWYYWGAPHTPVTDYRAAWAHVMSRFTSAPNVTWMATINRTYASAAPTSDYVIPGADMYGIDAYYTFPGDTFHTVFGQTIAQIKAVTDKPIMAAETGIGPVTGQARSIPGLIAGARANHLAGLVYLNENQRNASQSHQNWQLTPAAMKALHAALSAR